MKEFQTIILVFLGIIIIWFLFKGSGGLLGGLSQTGNRKGGETEKITQSVDALTASVFVGQVELRRGRAGREDRKEEYIEIRATKDLASPITITGWRLISSTTGKSYTLPTATYVVNPYEKNIQTNAILSPEEGAYIVTGSSPVGTSFKTNGCMGYLSERNTFTPSLPRQCPDITQTHILEKFGLGNNENCINFLETISQCTDYNGIPEFDEDDDDAISHKCEDYIRDVVTYEGCVEHNKNTPAFQGTEWYLYLDVPFYINDIWKEKDIVLLVDSVGKTVDKLEL